MLAKLSVRKPMLVFVLVALVIILGVVSFMRMTPDLLPNLEFPYVIVVTSYPGASPEKIESTITKPVEQAAATLDNIKSLSSQSSTNYSMVILEFNDDANMDATTMNLREKLDQIAASWPDTVGTPTILKINPDILPLNISAVSRDGYSTIDLSTFTEETLLPQLEGVEGVASVSLSGLIEENVDVIIRQEKIDALNKKIQAAIDKNFEEPEEEIEDAEEQLDKAEKQIKSGKQQIKDSEEQLATGRTQLETAITQLKQAIATGQAFDNTNYAANLAALQSAETAAQAALSNAQSAESAAQSDYDTKVAGLAANPPTATQTDVDNAKTALDSAKAATTSAQSTLTTVQSQISGLQQQKQLYDSLATNQAALTQAEAKLAEVAKGEEEIESAKSKLSSSKKKVAEGREELEDAKEELSEARQDAYNAADAEDIITMATVASILGAQDFSMPAGYVTDEDTEWLVYVGDELQTMEELSGLMLLDLDMDDLDPIYLTDVADVILKDNADDTYSRVDGQPGVLITFSKQSNYATATAADNVAEKFEELEQKYEGLHFISLMDQGDYIHMVVDSVLENLLQGAVLAVIILFIFLWDIRPTFIVACSIPISLTFAVVLMYFSGVTLNIISMSGLAVGVGMLVDNSIVVIENIYRLRKKGISVYRAAISGAVQVTGAITASTLTTVCVFLPIVFVQGITRQLFQDMALTIGYSLMASLLVALTVIPSMSTGLLKKEIKQRKSVIEKASEVYAGFLQKCLDNKLVVILLCVVLLIMSAYGTITKGFEYLPDMDSNQIEVQISPTDEDATLEDVAKIADTMYERISTISDVESIGVMQSSGVYGMFGFSSDATGSTDLEMYLVLKDDKTQKSSEISNQIEEMCKDLPAEITASSSGMDLSALTGSGITINIYAEDLDLLRESASDIAEIVRKVPGIKEVSDGLEETTPKLTISVDKKKATENGLTTAQVYQLIAAKISNEADAASVEDTGNDVVVLSSEEGESIDDIRNMYLHVTNNEGKRETIYLKDIATFTEGETLQSISRSDQKRVLSVTATLEDDYNVTLVTSDAEEALEKEYNAPDGVRYEFSGENESIMDALEDLLLLMVLGILVVYLIMVAQFQSLLSPFIVMMTIPLAFTGGLFALLIADLKITIVAMIGFVMLVGIIVNNGIVLIDCMNQLRATGLDRRTAVIEACRMRIRPVLMTALTTILGLIPLALGIGDGASLIQPVAVVAIGGLIYATLMTLFVVPVIYDAWCKKAPRVVSEADMELVQENDAEAVREEMEALHK